jgi:RNA polymerase sigma factor (TIGR02999 family)
MASREEPDWTAVTRLLADAEHGSKRALDDLFVLLYDRLRGMSHRFLAAHARHETLSTTALVHEAYLKLARDHDWSRRDREHFLSISARAMRQIVVDAARARGADTSGSPASTPSSSA